jgi:hypothetical protein
MHGLRFPIVRALVLGLVLALVHSALSFILLALALGGGFVPWAAPKNLAQS